MRIKILSVTPIGDSKHSSPGLFEVEVEVYVASWLWMKKISEVWLAERSIDGYCLWLHEGVFDKRYSLSMIQLKSIIEGAWSLLKKGETVYVRPTPTNL